MSYVMEQNAVSIIVFFVSVSLGLLVIISPIVAQLWCLTWMFLDDKAQVSKNPILNHKVLSRKVGNTTAEVRECGINTYYLCDLERPRGSMYYNPSTELWGNDLTTTTDKRALEEVKANLHTVVQDDYAPLAMGVLFALLIIYLLVTHLLVFTTYIASVAAVAYLARSVRRLQKGAVKLVGELRAHKEDKDAHT